MTLDEGDEPLAPRPLAEKDSAIACLSGKGRLLVFGLPEIKHLSGGGRGVILMALEKNEKLLAAQPITQRGVIVSGSGRGGSGCSSSGGGDGCGVQEGRVAARLGCGQHGRAGQRALDLGQPLGALALALKAACTSEGVRIELIGGAALGRGGSERCWR